jgi:outer membrane protein assembly factor BamB
MKTKFLSLPCILLLSLLFSCKDDAPVNKLPVSSFTASTVIAVKGASITFKDESTDADGKVVGWNWNFGNGVGTSVEQNPTYKFPESGSYTVTLEVVDDKGGKGSSTQSINIQGDFISKWEYATGNDVDAGGPAIGDDGVVYIGSTDKKLHAINPNGSVKWTYETGNMIRSAPAIGPDGTVYVGSTDFKIHAVNPATGAAKWTFATGNSIFIGGPSVGTDGVIYVGSQDANFYAINPDGTQKWKTALNSTAAIVRPSASISSDGSTLYFGANDGKFYALNTSTGVIKWTYTTGGKIEPSAAIATDGTIYFGSDDKKMYALSPAGTLVWSLDLGGAFTSSPAIAEDGTIYIGTKDVNTLFAVNPNGTKKWGYVAEGIILSSPAVGDDGLIYVGSNDGYLYVINKDGSTKYKVASKADRKEVNGVAFDDPRGRVWSAPAIKDGVLYYGSYDNRVYALVVSSKGLANSSWPMRGKNVKRTSK